MVGHRAMYDDGWKAVTRHAARRAVRRRQLGALPRRRGPSECRDLAARCPRSWRSWSRSGGGGRGARRPAARRPRRSRCSRRASTTTRRTGSTATTRTGRRCRRYRRRPPRGSAAAVGIWRRASIERSDQRRRHPRQGTENAGVALFVQDNRLVFDYNIFMDHHILESTEEVPAGSSVLGARFRRTSVTPTSH